MGEIKIELFISSVQFVYYESSLWYGLVNNSINKGKSIMLQMRIDVLAIDLFTRLILYIRYSTIYLFSAPVLTHFECQPWVHFWSMSLRVIKDINTSDACYDKVWGVRTKTFIIFTVSQLHCQQNIRRLTSMCPPFPISKPIKLGLPIQIIVIGHWSTE